MNLLRAGLTFLALTQAGVGGWALIAPRSFFDDFPLPSHPWVAMYPPYNEHLMRDFGALNLALCAVLAFAAVTLGKSLTRAVLAGYLVFAVPHFVFHMGHLGHMPFGDQVANVVVLSLAILLPLALWPLTRSAADDVIRQV